MPSREVSSFVNKEEASICQVGVTNMAGAVPLLLTAQQTVTVLTTSHQPGLQEGQRTELLLHLGSQHPPGPAFPTYRVPRLPFHLAAGCLHQLPSAAAVCEQYEVCDWPLPPGL